MKKQIMVKAWEIAKRGQSRFGGNAKEYFAESLKMAWGIVRKGQTIELEEVKEVVAIKDWFINKNYDSNEAFALKTADFQIIKETEKAYRLKAMTDFGNIMLWAPKSVCLNQEQFNAEFDKIQTRMNKGLDRNLELLKQAKEMGIKGVRKGMKTKTLERKISEHKVA